MEEKEIGRLNILWKLEVCDKAKEVDEYDEELWHSLCLGWAIGKGLSIRYAKEFAQQAIL